MRSLLRGSFALALVLSLVGCSSGSDGKDEAKAKETTTTTTTIPTLAADQVDADASPYCKAWADIRALGGPSLSGTPEQQAAARKSHYAKIVPLAEKLVAAADQDIKADAEFALDQARKVAETGSDKPFAAPDAMEHQQALAAYAQEHCAKK